MIFVHSQHFASPPRTPNPQAKRDLFSSCEENGYSRTPAGRQLHICSNVCLLKTCELIPKFRIRIQLAVRTSAGVTTIREAARKEEEEEEREEEEEGKVGEDRKRMQATVL